MGKTILILGNMGAGKSTLIDQLSRVGYTVLKIDSYYANTLRVNSEVSWLKDEESRSNAYTNLLIDATKLSQKKDIIIELTGGKRGQAFYEELGKNNLSIITFFIDVPIDELRRRVTSRNQDPNYPTKVDLEKLELMQKRFRQSNIKIDHVIDGTKRREEIFSEVLEIIG